MCFCFVFGYVCELFSELVGFLFWYYCSVVLKVIVLFVMGVGFLLDSLLIVFHSMCVFVCGPSVRQDALSICQICVSVWLG